MRVLKPTSLDKCLVVSQLCPEARYVALWLASEQVWTETVVITNDELCCYDNPSDSWRPLCTAYSVTITDIQLFDIVEEGVKDLTRLTANETTVITGLCRVGNCTRDELCASLQVSKSAVSNSLAAFRRLGLMSESTIAGTGRRLKLMSPTQRAMDIFADTTEEECNRLVMNTKWI